MKTMNIEEIWKSGKGSFDNQPVTDISQVKNLAGRQMRQSRTVMLFYAGIYLLMLLATVIVELFNLSGYRSNAGMTTIHLVILGFSVLFTGYGIFLVRQIRAVDWQRSDLVTAIRRQLQLFKVHYEIWLWAVCLTILMLTFSINSLIDNENGEYRINNPTFYLALESGVALFMYLMMKAAHYPFIRALRSHLTDLEIQSTEQSAKFQRAKRKWRWWALAGLLLVALLIAWVIIRGISAMQPY